MITLQQIYYRVCQLTNFENRKIFGEVTARVWCIPFYGIRCMFNISRSLSCYI